MEAEPIIEVKPRHLKFIKLTALDLCSTNYSLKIPKENIDEQHDQQVALTGCRDLELIFFELKSTLKEVHLGQWAFDELLIYISEICKQIEILEVNSA